MDGNNTIFLLLIYWTSFFHEQMDVTKLIHLFYDNNALFDVRDAKNFQSYGWIGILILYDVMTGTYKE